MITYKVIQHPHETYVQIQVFGHTVHVEKYPKYEEGFKLDEAVKDAQRRFAKQLADSLRQGAMI